MRIPLLLIAIVLLARLAAAAPIAATGYAIHTIATPDPVQGGVVRRGDALIVGQGGFGAGAQRIVRITDGQATTIATGFNSLGGFAFAADGRLYVVDNGGDLPGATAGDTLFAISDPLTRTDAIAAADATVVPSGTLPFAQDVAVLSDGRVLVSESVGPGAGTIDVVSGSTATTLVHGLDYASGLLVRGATILVANADAALVGSVRRFGLDGSEEMPLASSLSGAYALDVDGDGDVLVSGGSADDASSTVIAIDAAGVVHERARGFGFTTELFYDVERDETLVLDAGASAVTAICRDRDGDGRCDVGQGCQAVGTVSARVRNVPPITQPFPAAARADVRARVTFATNVPRAEPKQTGIAIRIVEADGVVLDLTVPPGNGWQRVPAGGGWRYDGTADGQPGLRVHVNVGKSFALVRVRQPGTFYGTPAMSVHVQLGSVCGTGTLACRQRGPRRHRHVRVTCG